MSRARDAAAASRRLLEKHLAAAAVNDLGADMYEALVDLGSVVLLVDRDGIIRWINPTGIQLLGDVRGRHYRRIIAPDFRHEADRRFASKVVGMVRATHNEAALLGTEGRRILFDCTSVALADGDHVAGVLGVLIPQDESSVVTAPFTDLTPRQAEVLRHLARGESTVAIASAMALSLETVRNHIRGILRALQVHSRLEAVVLARRLGLLDE
jgi:DNA-binding CsgD family transcriptional regulator